MVGDDRSEQFNNAARVFGIEGPGRLVCQNDRRRGNQCPGDRPALLLTAGEGIGTVVGSVPHPDRLEGGPRCRVAASLGDTIEHQRQADVLDE